MAITISKEILITKLYGDMGSVTDSAVTSVDVTYEASRLIDFDGTNATAEFNVSIGGVYTGRAIRLLYKYSGSGNPLDQAEAALQTSLTTIS